MRLRSAVPGLAIFQWGYRLSCFFHKSKRVPGLCVMAALLPALLISTAVAQPFTNGPIFQFAAFYNLDLDFTFGQGITLNGKVHANGNLWMCPQGSATFNDTVEATGVVTNHDNPNDQLNLNYISSYLHYNGGSPLSGVVPLFLATVNSSINPTNLKPILDLPPVGAGAPDPNAYTLPNQVYFYNKCDLIVSNSFTKNGTNSTVGTNLTVFYHNPYSTNVLTFVAGDVIVSNKAYYSFVTNVSFYDFREGKTVRAVQIDVARLNNWLSSSASNGGRQYNQTNLLDKGHDIDSIYVYNSVSLTSAQLPAVRVVNGQQLPSPCGLTIATPMPLYVLGHYNIRTNNPGSRSINTTNTAWTRPAALMADAITVLSGNWNDTNSLIQRTNNPSSGYGNRVVTSNITVNAACLAGIVPSRYTTRKQYSGGVENFLRLQEDWSVNAISFWYNGSVVAMFPSRYATNYWVGTTDLSGYPIHYHTAPARKWGFDANFLNPDKLPPLTPFVQCDTNPPVIISQPIDQTVASGNTAIFTVAAFSFTPMGCQWSFNGTNLDRATNTFLTLTNVQFSQAGNYAVLVTNAFGSVLSSNAVLTVTATPPMIQNQPTNQTVFVNGTAVFDVMATGSLPMSYQWSLNGTDLADITNTTLTLANVQTNQAGNYAVRVANAFGTVLSSNAPLTVIALPPTILTQPTNQTVFVYSNATFSVTASGSSPLSYQWSFNGTNIDGATNIMLTLTNVQPAQAGNYAGQVTNPFGSTNSVNATLVVVAQPTILVQPVNQTLMAGNMAFFSVTAVGFSPLNYQWQFNGTNFAGNTNSLLTLANANTNNNGSYQVIVTNSYGSVTSSVATLTVARSLVVVWGNQTNVPDGLANVTEIATRSGHNMALEANGTVAAWGGNTFGQTDVPADLTNVAAISAGASHSLALQSNGKVIGWGFNSGGQVNIPQNLTNVVAIAAGAFHSLALRADGTVAAWGEDYYGQTDVPGGLTNVVAIAACSFHGLALQANGTVVAWGRYGYGIDNVPAGLTNVVAIAGGNFHSLALRADGTVAAWGLNASGQTGVPLGLTNVVAIAAGAYYSLALQVNGTVVGWGYNVNGDTQAPAGLTNVIAIAAGDSHSMALENDGSPVILRQPASQTVLNGATILFNVPTVGRFPLSYQWQKDGANLTDGGNVSGATTAALTLSSVQTNDAGIYTLIVTNDFGSNISSNAVVTVLVLPSITAQPAGCTNIVGATINFNVVADGSAPLNYQWQANGTNLVDATNATLTLNNITLDQAGIYSVTIANDAGSVTSSNAVLSVYANAAALLNGCSFSYANGVQFTVAGVPGFNYAVQESTNLIDWISLITNTSPFSFTNINTHNYPQQFYRALYLP
jgi:alpha-tubulin suppressor-like RCC1 family protein